MKRAKNIFLFCLFLCIGSILSGFSLCEAIFSSANGSYVMIQHGQWATFLRVLENKGDELLLEEVSLPVETFFRMRITARNWYGLGAPHHCSWSISRLGLDGHLESQNFCTQMRKCTPAKAVESWLPTLFNLTFEPIPVQKRKKTGPGVGPGRRDDRPLWNPRLIVEGQIVDNVPFEAYTSYWPHDNTELANRRIEIYIPPAAQDANYPTFFPYFVEIEGVISSGKLRVIDSGKNLLTRTPCLGS